MFAIVIVIVLASSVDVDMDYNTFNMKYNSIAARLLYSPKCLAMEDSYVGEMGQRYQVLPGVIDWDKVTNENYKGCLNGITKGKNYDFSIAKVQESSGADATEGEPTDEEPTEEESTEEETQKGPILNYVYGTEGVCSATKWKRTDKYFIVINEGGAESQGVLKFCMNE